MTKTNQNGKRQVLNRMPIVDLLKSVLIRVVSGNLRLTYLAVDLYYLQRRP
jgi:hypothetical protein